MLTKSLWKINTKFIETELIYWKIDKHINGDMQCIWDMKNKTILNKNIKKVAIQQKNL